MKLPRKHKEPNTGGNPKKGSTVDDPISLDSDSEQTIAPSHKNGKAPVRVQNTLAKNRATVKQMIVAYGQAGPSDAAPAPAQILDDNTFKMFSVLDSFHDFTKNRNSKNLLKKDLLDKIFNSYKNLNFKEYSTKQNFEQKLYDTYVTNNTNITELCKLKINKVIQFTQQEETLQGTSGRRKAVTDEKDLKDKARIPILDDIATHYNIQKEAIIIVNDRGSYTGCNDEFEYIDTYAAWFDGTNNYKGNMCKRKTNIKLEEEAAVSIKTNDLFYIDNISGKYVDNTYKGEINFTNNIKSAEFSKGKQDDCRPDTIKFSKYITNNKENKKEITVGIDWFDEQFKKIYDNTPGYSSTAVKNCCMFLLDLKRAGDSLQIQSCKLKNFPNNKIPIFVTLDRIAAMIAVNKGVRTILTTQDGKSKKEKDLTQNYSTSQQYAILLEPTGLSRRTGAPVPVPVTVPVPVPVPKKDIHSQLMLNIIRPDDNKRTNLEIFKKFLKETTHDLKLNLEDEESIKTHIGTFIQCITDYIETPNPTEIMKVYLKFIINLTNKYIEDTNFAGLFSQLYINIYDICKIINVLNTSNIRSNRNRNSVVLEVDKNNLSFIKNLTIAKYINNIFKENEDVYKRTIGDPNQKSPKEMNYVIISPMGTIYMEHLYHRITTNNEIILLRRDINFLNTQHLILEGDSELLIMKPNNLDRKKLHDVILNFLKDIENTNDRQSVLQNIVDNVTEDPNFPLTTFGYIVATKADPRDDLRNLYNKIWNLHLSYMSEIMPLPTANIYGGLGTLKRQREPSGKTYHTQFVKNIIDSYANYSYPTLNNQKALYDFMKLPFQVKHMIIQKSIDKENIIKDVFNTFYKSVSFNRTQYDKELENIKYSKSILGIKLEPPIQSSSIQFSLFRESLYFNPEYIDPVMVTFMAYSNSPIPPFLTFESIHIKSTPMQEQIKKLQKVNTTK